MFQAICDCCGLDKMNVYMIRIECIQNASICIPSNFENAEVISSDKKLSSMRKLLLCSDCYEKTGLPLLYDGKCLFRKELFEIQKKQCKKRSKD